MSFYFADKTWQEIDEAIRNNSVAILPVGTTEEHGHHLPVATDAMIATEAGRIIGEACKESGIPALVLQTIQFGFSMGIVRRWAGCPNVDPDVFMDYIFNICSSLVDMGFRKVVLLDCHGNHDCLLRTVMRKIVDQRDIYIMILSPLQVAGKTYDAIRKDPEGDIHGGELETSCILAIDPKLVHTDRYTAVDAIRCNSILRGPVSTWGLQETKTGLFGDPTYASVETGQSVFNAWKTEGIKYIKEYMKT